MDWIRLYLEYTAAQESPEAFHFWSAMAVLGHALGRRVWLNQWFYQLYPAQMMVVLVSESAVTRKTTAMTLAADLLQYLPADRVNRLPSKLSPSILIDSLNRQVNSAPIPAVGLIVAEELGVFFSKESYAETLATLVNALNDAKAEFVMETRVAGKQVLMEPCLGLLGATTPTGLAHELPKAAQTAGTFGRFIIVYQAQPRLANPLTEAPPKLDSLRAELVRGLLVINRMEGEFQWTADGKEYYDNWYRDYMAGKRLVTASTGTDTGYWGRKQNHLLRVAMVLQASKFGALILDEPTLDAARIALETVETSMPLASKELGTSPFTQEQERILGSLDRFGMMTYGDLFKRHWRYLDKDRFRLAVKSLEEAGTIEMVQGSPPKWRLVMTRGQKLHRVDEADEEVHERDEDFA